MPKSKLKTYTVPYRITRTYEGEITVEAASPAEAKAMVQSRTRALCKNTRSLAFDETVCDVLEPEDVKE